MSTYKARKSAVERFGISTHKLLSTSALTAAGLVAMGISPALADGSWANLDQVAGQFDTDTPNANITNITLRTEMAGGEGNADIYAGDTVNVNGSLFYVRDNKADPTQILGRLNSNGRIVIIDGQGIFFGKNSQVDVGGLIATTGNITNEQFLNNNFGDYEIEGATGGRIELNGEINIAEAGLAAFVAPFVTNNGIINAKMGTVAFAAGETVTLDLYGDGLFEVAVDGELADALIENKGQINAEGGRVQMAALAAKDAVDNIINVDGVVTVASATQVGGKIVLSGGSKGVVNVEGSMDASGTDGGDINITGQNVNVAEAAEMKADGGNGADGNGDGGNVVFVADNAAIFRGNITAKGGANGGDGGYVDTSGLNYIEINGDVDVSAANGAGGLWYIDPRDLVIDTLNQHSSGNGTIGNPFRPNAGGNNASTSFLNVVNVTNALNTGSNVYITTIGSPNGSGDGDIEINTTILKSAGADATLTMDAESGIFFTGGTGISSTAGALNLDFDAKDSINANRTISTNGGNVAFNAGDDISVNSAMTTDGGNVTFTAGTDGGNDDVNINADVTTDGGDFFASAGDDVRVNATVDTSKTTAGSGGDITLKALGEHSSTAQVSISSNGKLVTTDNGIPGIFEGDVLIEAEDVVINTASGTKIDAADGFDDGDVTIRRSTEGTIGMGAGAGDMSLSQGELAAIDAENLTVGGDNTSAINVDGVNTTTATISNLVTLITSNVNSGGDDDVNFAGVNVFNALTVNSDDDITFADGASVETLTGDATFNGDENDGSVGNFEMGEGSSVDSNGNKIAVNALDVNLGEDALLGSEGGDINIVASDAFGDGNVNLASGALVDADGGNIVIDNDAIFFSEDKDSVTTHSGGTIDINQNEGGSIQNAVDAVENTGNGLNTIHVGAGTYEENILVIEDNFYLEGNNHGVDPNVGPRGPESIIDGGVGLNGTAFAVKNVGDNFTIDGFTITADGYGVDLGTGDGPTTNVTVKNNIIDTLNILDEEDVGVRGQNIVNGFVQNNLLDGIGNDGIAFTNSENINITDNTLFMVDFNGIKLDGVNGSVISGNIIDSTGVGFLATEGDGIIVKNGTGVNTISDNMVGVNEGDDNIAGDGIEIANTDNATVTGNTINNAAGNGIYNNGSDGTQIGGLGLGEANTIANVDGAGVLVNPSSGVDVLNNIINGALQGVKVENSSNTDVIGNTISNVTDGVELVNTTGSVVQGNGITNASVDGIRATNSNGALIGGPNAGEENTITNSGDDGIHVNASGNVTVQRNIINGTVVGTNHNGIEVTNSTGTNHILGNRVSNAGWDGIKLVNGPAQRVIGNVITDSRLSGVAAFNTHGSLIAHNDIDRMGTWGMYLVNINGSTVRNNSIDTTGRDGIEAHNSSNIQILNNQIGTNGAVDNIGQEGVDVNNSPSATIFGNTITETVSNGISINPSPNSVIQGNTISNVGADGILVVNSDGTLVGGPNAGEENTITNVGDDGVNIVNSENARVIRNRITTTGNNGVEVVGGSHGTLISRNRIQFAGWDGVNVIGSNDVRTTRNTILDTIGASGVAVLNSTNNQVDRNNIRRAGRLGVYVGNGDDILVNRNTIRDTGLSVPVLGSGIHVENSDNGRVARNDIRRTAHDGINLGDPINYGIVGNTGTWTVDLNKVDETARDGIHARATHGVEVTNNTVGTRGIAGNIGQDGIHINGSNGALVQANTVSNASAHGILVNPSDNVSILGNTVSDVAQHGIFVNGGTGHNIRENTVRRAGWDGITVRDFGTAWIAYNDIKWTGDDGIHAEDGDFVSIYNNYVDLSGFMPNTILALGPIAANVEVGEDANGIYVDNVGSEAPLPPLAVAAGFGYGTYGTSVEIYGNDVANSEDDGIQVESSDSAYIANNIVGHVGDDGVDIDDVGVTYVRDNAVSLAGDKGITIDGGRYAGVFDNRVLLTGNDGIQVENVHGGLDAMVLGDIEYGYGWSVNVSGNEVAMTGDDGIEVRNSGPTKVAHNDVFMAGMGEGLGEVVDMINDFASETFEPVFALRVAPPPVEEIPSFDWSWGDGHGINVHGIEGAYYSPNGWAADIRGNTVKYTGGHGILAENNDRTRIKNNTVKYAGIDETTFFGASSMMSLLNNGPFHRSNPGRRDLWIQEGSMIEVLDGYIGRPDEEPEEPEYGDYITVENVSYDNHDGIHAENIHGQYSDGISGRSYLYDLKIKGNDVRRTGDDGIEVLNAGRTLIAENTVRHAGYGDELEYAGDYYGADGIHVRGVSTDIHGGQPRPEGLSEGEEGYEYERPRNYALIIRNNDVRNTADDGIEVVGGEGSPGKFAVSGLGEPEQGPHYYGHTDRVLIAENTIRKAGYFDNEINIPEPGLDHGYENVGEDGYGHDGIHVRNINGTEYYDDVMRVAGEGASGEGPYGFYGYAVDIIDNDVRKTGDDGIEVFNSQSTLILDNTVRQSGVYWDRKRTNTDGADYYGADGIHVRNVGGANPDYYNDGYAGPEGFQPYSVAIVGNDVRKTADDGIEVVGEFNDYGWDTRISDDWDDDVYRYDGTGRTLILANVTRDNGVSGHYGNHDSYYYDSRTGSGSSYGHYGNRGSYDGYGGDGIHVRGVGANNNGQNPWNVLDIQGAGASGGPIGGGDYAVQIIGNDVRRTGDDGIEVIGSTFNDCCFDNISAFAGQGPYPPHGAFGRVLIADNFVKKSGLSGGSYSYNNMDYSGYDEGGYYNGYSYSNDYSYYGNAGNDGYGADGIHVRGVGVNNGPNQWLAGEGAGDNGRGYYGYAVDILGNTVRRTGDDGIEVRNSDSTFIAYNDVKNSGKLTHRDSYYSYNNEYTDYGYNNSSYGHGYWHGGSNDEGNYTGGDGIHVENVGTNGLSMEAFAGGLNAGRGFEPYAVVIKGNTVDNSADDGIEVLYSGRTRIQGNDVTDSGLAYFNVHGHNHSTYQSYPYYSYSYGHENEYSHGAMARDGRGADGIHVGGVYLGEGGQNPWEMTTQIIDGPYNDGPYRPRRIDAVEIIGNTVDNSADDGIQVVDSGDTLIRRNTVTNSGTGTYYGGGEGPGPSIASIYDDYGYGYYSYGGTGEIDSTGGDGINVSRDRLRGKRPGPRPRGIMGDQFAYDDGPSRTRIRIIGNTVSESADDGIEVIGSLDDNEKLLPRRYRDRTNVLIARNDVENSGDNGIALITTNPFGDRDEHDDEKPSVFFYSPYGNSIMNSRIIDNEVRNSGNNGLHVEGYNHNRVKLSGNTFIDNPTGARFESGHVDLTGRTNRFIVNSDFELPEGFDHVTGMQFELAGEVSDPTSLTIVDETLGTTSFSGFINRPVGKAFYVRFEDGAILDSEGNVIVIDGTRASWDGVVPRSFGNVLPANVLQAIEDRLWDADDPLLNGRGQIFVGTALQSIDNVEDFFNRFGPVGGGLSGLNLTVTGLPPVNLPVQNLAGIAPFAGGEDVASIEPAAGGDDGEGVADIEPEAGGEEASCWGDILSAAATGGVVNYSFTGSAEEALADASSCGSQTL